ncbi:MlaA family lipoprotein [Halomonas halocynthiae]|uniref:MlaA family lipoprotein n=1 Tax=Halomonas halocynthiae TaxID=176290 RepID=UPI000417B164|nr:VacJ family lipoprotein [Halomonas halocynthiae]
MENQSLSVGHVAKRRRKRRALSGLTTVLTVVALSGCAGTSVQDRNPDDPWEGFNRKVFAFNEVLDRYALKPVAQGYNYVTPEPVQTGVGNFFSNLGEIRTTINSLLQGKPGNAGVSTGRFVLNSTLGIAGIFDVATDMELTGNREDFGQTLGVWGVGEGPYLVLPLLGPSMVRDTAGLPADVYTSPLAYVDNDRITVGLALLDVIDTRAGYLDQEKLISGDRYVFLRDTYLQRRRFEVLDGQLGRDPFASDEFDLDDVDFDDAFAD